MKLKGRTPIKPTEDPEKVLRCILNIFPNCDHEVLDGNIEFFTNDIDRFMEILREQQIRDTAVMVLGRSLEGDSCSFFLNKQAAYMDQVNFTDGDSTLGNLEITILEGARELIESITPILD